MSANEGAGDKQSVYGKHYMYLAGLKETSYERGSFFTLRAFIDILYP